MAIQNIYNLQQSLAEGEPQQEGNKALSIYDELAKIINEETIHEYSTGRGQLDLQGLYRSIAEKHNMESDEIAVIGDHVIDDIELNPTDNPQMRKSRMAAMFADWGLEAAKIGTSIFQIAKANKGLKMLREPDFEARQKDMSEIDSLINDFRKRAQGEFPVRARERDREYADLMNRTMRTARQFGVQGAALQQAAHIEGSKSKRAGEMDDESLKMQYSGMLSDLLRLKESAEQFDATQAQEHYLRAELPMYQSDVAAYSQAKRAGVENLFGSLEGLPYRIAGSMNVLDDWRTMRRGIEAEETERQAAMDRVNEKKRIDALAEVANKKQEAEYFYWDDWRKSAYDLPPTVSEQKGL